MAGLYPALTIRGSGIAACCAARLLSAGTVRADAPVTPAAMSPVLLINPASVQLLCDVVGSAGFLAGLPLVTRRVVLWGDSAAPLAMDHRGLVVEEHELLRRLWSTVSASSAPPDSSEWSIISSLTAAPSRQMAFGNRSATAARVELTTHRSETCWIESVEAGWLFLVANGATGGSLLAVGGSLDSLLAGSRLVAGQIQSCSAASSLFPVHPRIASPLCGSGWLACGSAAMAFDPICGEGVGHAVREAILASACLRAILQGANAAEVLAHYSARLLAGFSRHLENCKGFYQTSDLPWWREQMASLDAGSAWVHDQLSSFGNPRFRLSGFDLEALG